MAPVVPRPSRGARGQRGLGVPIGLVQLEPEHGRGGELQVDDRAGAGRAEFGGDVPRLRQAPSARVVEHVDRAELMQSTQPPHGQPGRVGRGEGQFEGLPGAVEIAGPADPAEQLQRPAPNLGARPRRGQGALGEGTRPVARVVGGQGDLRVQHGRLRAEAGLGVGGEQVARDADVPPCDRPPGPVHRRVGQLKVDRRPPDGAAATRREPGDDPVSDQHRLVHLPGQGQGLDEERFGLGALIRRGEQARSPHQIRCSATRSQAPSRRLPPAARIRCSLYARAPRAVAGRVPALRAQNSCLHRCPRSRRAPTMAAGPRERARDRGRE